MKYLIILLILIVISSSCKSLKNIETKVVDDTFLQLIDTIGYTQNSLLYVPNYISKSNLPRSININTKLLPFDSIYDGLQKDIKKDTSLKDYLFNDQQDKTAFLECDKIKNKGRYLIYNILKNNNLKKTSVNLGQIFYSEFLYNEKRDKVLFAIKLQDNIKSIRVRLITAAKKNNFWIIESDETIESS